MASIVAMSLSGGMLDEFTALAGADCRALGPDRWRFGVTRVEPDTSR